MIPRDSPLYRALAELAKRQRMVFIAGLPGVGKSFLLKQLALLAREAGRAVHLLQWDVTRAAFETEENRARYPEVNGFTHAVVRKAVGVWARGAVQEWHEEPAPEHMLIGELPLVGHRLIELAEAQDDAAEPLLVGPSTLFLLPVPSREVRRVIEAARERSIARPRHARESADAPPNVLRALWEELYREAYRLGLRSAPGETPPTYDPVVHAEVYQHLLRHRRTRMLSVDAVLPASGSVYDLGVVAGELAARPEEVRRVIARVEADLGG